MLNLSAHRTSKDDFLYSDEIEEMVTRKTITTLHTAFSREEEGKRVYVQNKVQENAGEILTLLDRYVCSNSHLHLVHSIFFWLVVTCIDSCIMETWDPILHSLLSILCVSADDFLCLETCSSRHHP